jgi:hypothetical protein
MSDFDEGSFFGEVREAPRKRKPFPPKALIQPKPTLAELIDDAGFMDGADIDRDPSLYKCVDGLWYLGMGRFLSNRIGSDWDLIGAVLEKAAQDIKTTPVLRIIPAFKEAPQRWEFWAGPGFHGAGYTPLAAIAAAVEQMGEG